MTTLIYTADKIGLTGLAGWFKRLEAKLSYNSKVRQTMKELSSLSDHELNDIGIARGDIYGIAHGDDTLEVVRRNNIAKVNKNLAGWV